MLVVTAIISVQFGAAIAKQLFDEIGFTGVVFLRTFLGGIIFLIIVRPKIFGYAPRVYAVIGLYALVIAANMLLFYASIERIPLGIAVAIAFLGPLSLSVIGSRKPLDLLWVALALGGILLLSPITDVTLDPIGIGLAFACAAAWATIILVAKRAGEVLPGNGSVALAMCAAAFVTAPFGAANALQIVPHFDLIGVALVVAVFSSFIPFMFEFVALRRMSPRVFGLLMSLEPAAAALIGWVILSEALGIEKIIGIGLVVIASIATTRSEH
ncbi:MAG: EamA family transporter [Chloroflexota bacterium]|nr:EamA family transporter [Chloroflexota bacterium]